MGKLVKPEWESSKHPHDCYSFLARMSLAVLGSVPPLGVMALTSKMPDKLSVPAPGLSTGVLIFGAIIVATWMLGIIKAIRAEQKDLLDYGVLGGIYPANTFLILYALQAVIN